MLKNGKSKAEWNLYYFGCSCCNSKRSRRRAKHSARQTEKRAWKKEVWYNK